MGKFFKVIGIIACLALAGLLVFAIISDDDSNSDAKTEKSGKDSSEKKDSKKKFVKKEKETSDDVSSNSSWGNGKVVSISESDFRELVADYKGKKKVYVGDGPAIVDCYATWCGPCKALSPVLEKLAKKYKGKLQIYKIDVDKAPNISKAYGIQSIPFLFFCAGNEMETMNGAPSQSELEDIIDEMLEE